MRTTDRARTATPIASVARAILVIALLVHCAYAGAQLIHEEVEPNNTPASATELAGEVRIQGAFAEGDTQDAFIWSVSEADARKRWTIRLNGREGFRTVLWLMQLSYQDGNRAVVQKRIDLLKLSVRGGDRPAQLSDILVAPGEYLIGLSPLPEINPSAPLAALQSATEPLAAQSSQSDAQDDQEAESNNRYELSLFAVDGIAADAMPKSGTNKLQGSVASGRPTSVLSSVETTQISFRVGGKDGSQRWTLRGAGELGTTASVQVLNKANDVVVKTETGPSARFELPSLVLPAGDYRIAINSDAPHVARHFFVALDSVGQYVEGDEAEPNDTAAQANWFELDKAVSANVDKASERDHFRFGVSDAWAGKAFDLSVSFDNADNAGSVCLNTLAAKSIQCRAVKGSVIFESLVLPAATYRLAVTRFQKTGPYQIAAKLKPRAKPGVELEPNDTPAFAYEMGRRKAITGTLSGEDVDVISFEVTDPDVQYRVQTKGVGRMTITDDQNRTVSSLATPHGADTIRVEALDLLPGRYQVKLSHGLADRYRLIVRNLGKLPADFEREPNDDLAGALRLRVGEPRRGMLPTADPRDVYVFRMDGRDQRRLSITAPDDGPIKVRLEQHGGVVGSASLKAGEKTEFQGELEAGFYALTLYSGSSKSQGHYRVLLEHAERSSDIAAEQEPNNWFADGQWLAPGGRMKGAAGGLGGDDFFRVKRPSGSGYFVHHCDPSSVGLFYAGMLDDEFQKIAASRQSALGLNVRPFTTDDAQLWFAAYRTGPYDCQLLVEPDMFEAPTEQRTTKAMQALLNRGVNGPPAPPDKKAQLVEEPVNGAAQYNGVLTTRQQKVHIPIDTPAGSAARIACSLTESVVGQKLDLRMLGGDRGRPLADGSVIYRTAVDGKNDALLVQGRSDDWTKPLLFTCAFKTQALMTPWPAARESPKWSLGEVKLSSQRVAAYVPDGQRLDGSLQLSAGDGEDVVISLASRVSGRNWRVKGLPDSVELEAGKSKELSFTVLIPPNTSSLSKPRVTIVASEQTYSRTVRSAAIIPDATLAKPVQATRVRQTPAALAGGLNVLDVRLGARIVSIDGKPIPKDGAKYWQDAKHNGEAPLENGSGIGGKDVVFEVAGGEPIALRGFVFNLRSVTATANWAHTVHVSTSLDAKTWSQPRRWRLESVFSRQHLVLPEPVKAKYVRLVLNRVFQIYNERMYFNEFMAIAQPGAVPESLKLIDLAERRWGGHVVAARGGLHYPPHLTDPARGGLYFPRSKIVPNEEPPSRYWILGFASNRIARITGVEWVRDERDTGKPTPPLQVLVAGDEIGDFKPIGTLARPGKDETSSRLDFETPVWARFIKFETPGSIENYLLPKVIRVFEDQSGDRYRSVAALWDEDDRQGPFEWLHPMEPVAVVKAGGASAKDAPVLTVGSTTESSARFGDVHDDWFRINVPAGEPSNLLFGLDGGEDLRQTALLLMDQTGKPVATETLTGPPVTPGGEPQTEAVFTEQRPDRKIYSAKLNAGQDYFVRITVPGRNVVLRAEDVGVVRSRSKAITRSLRAWADELNGESDGLQLIKRSPYDGPDGFVRGRARILKALNGAPVTGGGTSSFATAMQQVTSQMAPIDGAKLMVGFATGAIFSDGADFWYPDLLAEQPIRFWSMYLACPGVFGCPATRDSANRMRSAAAAANGEFRRLAYPDDVEESLAQAMAYLNAPKPYRLSVAYGRALSPTEMPPGKLLVEYSKTLEKQLVPAVSVVLDASGSMLKRMPGSKKRRIHVARASLTELISKGLPDNVKFTYRAFGLKPGACDTKALIHLGKLNKKQATQAIAKTPVANRAKTAIAASITAAAADLGKHTGPKTIVIVTDGEETCDGDVAGAIEALKQQGLAVKIQIVGFAIGDGALKDQFASWAKLGGGRYFDANDKAVLTSSLIEAVSTGYSAVSEDRPDDVVAAKVGEEIEFPPGVYQLRFDGDVAKPARIEIRSGQRSTLVVNPINQ